MNLKQNLHQLIILVDSHYWVCQINYLADERVNRRYFLCITGDNSLSCTETVLEREDQKQLVQDENNAEDVDKGMVSCPLVEKVKLIILLFFSLKKKRRKTR